MIVYLSHAVNPEDGPLVSRLRAVASGYNITVRLPDRQASLAARVNRMKGCHAVVALAIRGASVSTVKALKAEINGAVQKGLPVIAVAEEGTSVSFSPEIAKIGFNRDNPTLHEQELLLKLKSLGIDKSSSGPNTTALKWFIGIGIGMLALGALATSIAGDGAGDEDEDL